MIINKELRNYVLPNGETSKELVISYIDESGSVKFLTYKIPKEQMFKWVYAKNKKFADQHWISWDNKPVKKVPSKSLDEFRLNELLCSFGHAIDPIWKPNAPKTWFCDIETNVDETGFPEPEVARQPINTIALTSFPETIVWGRKALSEEEIKSIQNKLDTYADGMTSGYKFTYKYFPNEADLLRDFFNFIKDVPAITGWNFLGFDWLYIINRAKNLGLHYEYISPTGKFYNFRLDNKTGKINISLPMHKIIYDYLLIYKKWDYSISPKENNTLNFVAEKALGYKKVSHPGFIEFYRDFYEDYVFYNAVDTILVEHIDKKLQIASVMYSLAAEIKVEINDTLGTIKPVHTAIANFVYPMHKVIAKDNSEISDQKDYEGAFVWPSQPGVYKYVGYCDFASLYPSIIRSFLISFENFVGMAPTGYKPKSDEIVTSSGAILKKVDFAVMPEVTKFYYNERKAAKGLKKIAAKQLEDFKHILKNREDGKAVNDYKSSDKNFSKIDPYACSIEELKSEISRLENLKEVYENKQLAFKIFINSIYGSMASKYFIGHKTELAEAITLQGQHLNHYTEISLNEYFEGTFQNDIELHKKLGISTELAKKVTLAKGRLSDHGPLTGKLYSFLNGKTISGVVKGDTDSCCFEFGRIVNQLGIKDDKAPKFVLDLWVNGVRPYLKQRYQDYCDSYNCAENAIELELEKIERTSLVYAKKRYAIEICWDDSGVFYKPMEKVTYTGLEVVQGSTPKYARECQKDLISFVLENYSNSNEKPAYIDLISRLKKYKSQLVIQSPDDICKTQSIGDYNKFILNDKNAIEIGQHCPIHVKSAAIANHLLYKNNKYLSKYSIIRTGDKIKYYYSKDKTFDVFGFLPSAFPVEYAPKIDYDEQFEKLILDPLNKLISNVLGYQELNRTLCYTETLF